MGNNHLHGFTSRAIHTGYHPSEHHGALNPPVAFSSTFVFDNAAQGAARFAGEEDGYIYSRIGNPTVTVLEDRMAALEGGEAAIATASGMGAITSTLWTFLKSGDEIIADHTLYGCTFALMQEQLSRFGITVKFVDMTDARHVADAITDKTRFVYFESIANPNMRIMDIAAIVKAVKNSPFADQILTMVDNTYPSPYLCQPLSMGVDIVIHSATKYLGGHGDLIAGMVIGNAALMTQIRLVGIKDMTGASMAPMEAFLIQRGLKTLGIRMDRHSETALEIATRLEQHPAIAKVIYPGLASHPQHELAQQQFKQNNTNGKPLGGGMIGFELKAGYNAGLALIDHLNMILCAVSLGDAHSLIQHPASMTHSTYSAEDLAKHDIAQGLIRLSVGLEDLEDIWADLAQALAAVHNPQMITPADDQPPFEKKVLTPKRSFLTNIFDRS